MCVILMMKVGEYVDIRRTEIRIIETGSNEVND